MNPQDPASFRSRIEKLKNGRSYHFIDERPANYSQDTPVILALHGFPDRWYGWRYQIGPWVSRGWRVIVPDSLGYGESDKPTELSAYTTKNLANDMVALLDAEKISQVIVVAHDWGAYLGWRIALWHPVRVRMIVCLSVPFYPPAPVYIPPKVAVKRVPLFAYQLYLASEGATQEIQERPARLVDTIYRSGNGGIEWAKEGQFRKYILGEPDPTKAQDLLSPQEFKFYEESFSKPMHGPLAYYKTTKLRFDEEKDAKLPSRLPTSMPALYLRGTEDPSSPPDHARRSKNFVPSLKIVTLKDAGHWLMVEKKDEVTSVVGDWIEETLRSEKTNVKL